MWVTSPLQGEEEGEGFFSTPGMEGQNPITLVLSPCLKGEKGWQVNFIYQS